MSQNKETVSAIVVTYNRKKLLIECLEGLLKQTRPIDAIFLIDNFSNDGTPELLHSKGYINELPPEEINKSWEKEFIYNNEVLNESIDNNIAKIEHKIPIYYVRMNENTGGAGGFHEGVKRSYESNDFDWLWLMDDDIEPENDALQLMLDYKKISLCIHPQKKYFDGTCVENENFFNPVKAEKFYLYNRSFKNGKDWCSITTGCFEGMLIHKDIVGKIGYPDKRFFIWGDDAIYGFLASLYTNTIYIKDAYFKKKIKKDIVYMNDFQLYYSLRNDFLTKSYMEDLGFYRGRSIYFYFKLLRRGLINVVKSKNIKQVYVVFKALMDGHCKKYSKASFL